MNPNARQLIQERFDDWSQDPTTQALRRFLASELASLKDQWANGAFTADSVERLALLQANAIGQCEVLQRLLDLDSQQLFPEQDE